MVTKLVSVPPSQRLVTKNSPQRARLLGDRLLRLALGADEQDAACPRGASCCDELGRLA